MYGSNPRLVSAVKGSNEKQEFLPGDGQIMADAGGFMKVGQNYREQKSGRWRQRRPMRKNRSVS